MSPILMPCCFDEFFQGVFERADLERLDRGEHVAEFLAAVPWLAVANALLKVLFVVSELVVGHEEEIGVGQDVAGDLQPVAGRLRRSASASDRLRRAADRRTSPAFCRNGSILATFCFSGRRCM